MDTTRITLALAGNPNSGKTTIFNALTGARQHVGNYPGVTVERREGRCRHRGVEIRVIDLPGTYSLNAYSPEEVVARDVLVDERPDVVVDILDATSLERNLYLAVQIMELGMPVVLALNMSDAARARGMEFNLDILSRLFGAPFVPTVGHRGEGTEALLDAAVAVARGERGPSRFAMRYSPEIEEAIARIEPLATEREEALARRYGARWVAIKLLEEEESVRGKIRDRTLLEAAAESAARLEKRFGDRAALVLAEERYGVISGACQEAVRLTAESRHDLSDRIDTVLTHPVLGMPIFLLFMYLTFYLTFTFDRPPMRWIELGLHGLGSAVGGLWRAGAESPLKDLLLDGVLGGVGGVVIFLPNILFLFLAIAFLEDTGYMARAAFLMDRFMHKIGLHGKSFIPLLIGFGCSVPAILAARTLESRRDRFTTILVTPLMSCGARLTIYSLLIPPFFAPAWRAPVLWSLYLIGVLLAVAGAKLLRSTLFRGETEPFVMELPPYRMPTLRNVLLHMWDRAWSYLRKAGTLILGISILFWAMTMYPKRPAAPLPRGAETAEVKKANDIEYSLTGRLGKIIEPALKPLGFDWKIGTALVGAFAAKEIFVAEMGIVYAVGESEAGSEALQEKLRKNYSPLTAFCIMLFSLISTPCAATFVVTWRETGRVGWALFQLAALTVLAYGMTFLVYQAGSVLGLGAG
ncbi:MAG: ferrous iron transport protein B [Planctomycetota bacterium]